jgi:hypothetical protein
MGGTKIFEPLNSVIQNKMQDNIKKKVFLLTDGSVSKPELVIELVKKYNEVIKVHTFGIGSGCSKYLVKEVARAGRGSYCFVEENENLKSKVISALKKAT